MSVVAIVPVRCGSKSIPFKNIKLFCGKPLLFWNLQELQNTHSVEKIVVATDCNEISDVVNQFNFSKVEIYRRDPKNATDTASTESVMLECIKFFDLFEDIIMLVQVTSPLTTREDFEMGIEKINIDKADSLLSCVRLKRFLWSNEGLPLNYDFNCRPRRQEFLGTLIENGAFYINYARNILKDSSRLSGKISIYEMQEYTFVEIDEEYDWIIAEQLMKRYFKYLEPLLINPDNIKLVVTDVDGVLTDSGMYYSEKGDELKKFNTRDGKGFEILRNNSIRTAIITSEKTDIVERRGLKLKADYLIQGVTGDGKLKALLSICEKEKISISNCAYIGDDINCLEILKNVGYAFCPSNAEQVVRNLFNVRVLNSNGGNGVFRELVNLIVQVKN